MIFTGYPALNLDANNARGMLKYNMTALNYSEHLKLKYNITIDNMSKALKEIFFEGNIKDAVEYEKSVKNTLINTLEYDVNDWNNFLKYGGFPRFYTKHPERQKMHLMDIIYKVVHDDMPNINNFTTDNQTNIHRIISFLALQQSQDISYEKLAKHIKTSKSNVKNILNILEKTRLIFHIESYGTSSQRLKNAWKYYFATSSLKHSLITRLGNNSMQSDEYEGVLLENMAATLLGRLSENQGSLSYLFYDANKKNVDFLLKKEFKNPIPIKIERGKDKKYVKKAMNNYDSSHGIIISKTAHRIYKEDDIIFISPKTFSLLK